jgi:hypothetical protein
MHDFLGSRALGIAFILGALASGCSHSDESGEPAGSSRAAIRGRIASAGGADVEMVHAYRFESSGALVELARASIADERYEVAIDLAAAGDSPIVVVAESGSEVRGSVTVFGDAAVDGVIVAAPIDVETTVESDVYAELRAGSAGAESMAALRLFVDGEMAQALSASSDYAGDVAAAAEGVLAAATAFDVALAELGGPDAGARIDAAAEALATAQAELDAALDEAKAPVEVMAATAGYARAYLEAYAAAGFAPEELAAAAHAATGSLEHFAGELDAEVQGAAQAHANAVLALAVSASATAQMTVLGATEASLAALAAARAELEERVTAAGGLGAGASAEIAAAWSAYAAVLDAELDATMGLGAGVLAAAVAGANELEGDLDAAIAGAEGDAAAVGETLGEAHASFLAECTANGELLGTVGSSEAEAHAALALVAELSLAR